MSEKYSVSRNTYIPTQNTPYTTAESSQETESTKFQHQSQAETEDSTTMGPCVRKLVASYDQQEEVQKAQSVDAHDEGLLLTKEQHMESDYPDFAKRNGHKANLEDLIMSDLCSTGAHKSSSSSTSENVKTQDTRVRILLSHPEVTKEPQEGNGLQQHVLIDEEGHVEFPTFLDCTQDSKSLEQAEEGGEQISDFLQPREQHDLHQEIDAHGTFASPTQCCRDNKSLIGRCLHKLLEKPPSLLSNDEPISFIMSATEIDTLYPNTLDGPAIRLRLHSEILDLQVFIILAGANLRVLRLPRLRRDRDINLEDFFSAIGTNSSSLKELVFEDDGFISTRTANLLFEKSNLEKLEVYRPGIPVIRALTIGCCILKEVCFHSLTTDLEKDLSMFLHRNGSSLKSLHLGFNLSIEGKPVSSAQRSFWKQVISFLNFTVPITMSRLNNLELSSSPLFNVRHRFNSASPESSCSATENDLCWIESLMRAKCTTRHPKETEISLKEIRLAGGAELVADALNRLSWVNQSRMGVQLEIPGVRASFQQGYGEIIPVVLQSLQLDQFICERVSSQGLEITALKEVDLGESAFVQRYSTGDSSILMREATRRLIITSRESLSIVRAYHRMPNREMVMNISKLLFEILALAPLVTRLELSRDIVFHAILKDKEYVDILMKLRVWKLKTIHLYSARNYNTEKQDRSNVEGPSSTNAFAEFLQRLPAFLTILAMACPRLENLVLEREEMDCKLEKEKKTLVTDALKALDVYEMMIPTVNATTVRWQIHEWRTTHN